MKRIACVLLAVQLAVAVPARAADGSIPPEPGFSLSSRIDWGAGTVAVEITRSLDPSVASTVRAKGDAETDIESRLPGFLARAVAPLVVDSSHTFGDLLGSDPGLFARVRALFDGARRDALFLSADFSSLVARYTIPLFGERGIILPLLHSKANPIRRALPYVTTRNYTGLLIYARGALPESGTTRTAAARPALFPRIWDEQMNLVLEKGMCFPESLARWGMVGYAASIDDAATLRAGALPLRLAARGVFGDHGTDIVISTDGARQLLSLAENIALLQEGRICIVYDSLE